jgi:hypothetical protein
MSAYIGCGDGDGLTQSNDGVEFVFSDGGDGWVSGKS